MQVDQQGSEKPAGVARLSFLESGAAKLELGSPGEKVITLTRDRMVSLKEILAQLKSAPPRALFITGSGPEMFTAGADINIIKDIKDAALGESLAREGQKIFDDLAALPCPTIALISGPCVGGGCELALACQYRLISDHPSSQIGLPEVKLGILPGFGGTQRLPRLIGLPKALDIILAGKTLRPKQALSRGLVDEVLHYDQMLARAEALVAAGPPKGCKAGLVDKLLTFTGPGRAIVKSKASKTIAKQSKGFYPAPPLALQSAIYGLEKGMQAGLEFEARELGRLAITPECKSLVKIFFMTEAAKGLGRAARKEVEQLDSVVIGAGIMGAGIAGSLAKSGLSVIMKDTSDAALERGVNHIKKYLADLKYLSDSERSFILNRIESTTRDPANIGNARLVLEAVFEDPALKKKVLGDIAKLVQHDAILATNTSSLSVSELASTIENPSRVIGMHFFNPVEKMPLVEIIRGSQTSDKTTVMVAALTAKLGKYPIIVNDVPGFLVNRILSPYLMESGVLVSEGYSVAVIDKAATRFGMPMGPVRLLDEVGLDVAVHVSEIMVQGYGDRMRGPGYAKKMTELGRFGRKSGAGFYNFKDDQAQPEPRLKEMLGITASRPDSEIDLVQERLIMRLVNEAVLCLDEGVAGQPGQEAADQIDLGTVMGIGFPPFRGGLMHYADALGAKKIYERLSDLATRHGPRFAPAPGIKRRADAGKNFHQAA